MDFLWSNIYFRIIGIPLIFTVLNLLFAQLAKGGKEESSHKDFRTVGLSMCVAALGINAAFSVVQKTAQSNNVSLIASDAIFQRFWGLTLMIFMALTALAYVQRRSSSVKVTLVSVIVGALTIVFVFYSWSI